LKIRPEIQIFPFKLISKETADKITDELTRFDFVTNVSVHGPSISSNENENYMVGWIWIEVEDNNEDVQKIIKDVCDEFMPFGYTIEVGRFTKYKKGVSDYIKGLN